MPQIVSTAPRDGNGWPGGLRLSWPALAIIVTTLGLGWAVNTFVQNGWENRLEDMETRILERMRCSEIKLENIQASLSEHRANHAAHGYTRRAP